MRKMERLNRGADFHRQQKDPTLKADLFGDWREEPILTDGENHIVIVRTLAPTEYGIRCLMHDPWHRNSAANQNICYNQVGFASIYLGDEAPLPEKRNDLCFESAPPERRGGDETDEGDFHYGDRPCPDRPDRKPGRGHGLYGFYL